MSKIFFKFKEDAVAKYTPIPEMPEDMYNAEVIMTKEIFQECYKRWIEPQESGEINEDNN